MGPLSVAAALDFASNIRSNLLTKFPLISNFPFSLCHLNIYIFFSDFPRRSLHFFNLFSCCMLAFVAYFICRLLVIAIVVLYVKYSTYFAS